MHEEVFMKQIFEDLDWFDWWRNWFREFFIQRFACHSFSHCILWHLNQALGLIIVINTWLHLRGTWFLTWHAKNDEENEKRTRRGLKESDLFLELHREGRLHEGWQTFHGFPFRGKTASCSSWRGEKRNRLLLVLVFVRENEKKKKYSLLTRLIIKPHHTLREICTKDSNSHSSCQSEEERRREEERRGKPFLYLNKVPKNGEEWHGKQWASFTPRFKGRSLEIRVKREERTSWCSWIWMSR